MANTTFTGNVRENGDGNRDSIAGSMAATANFHIANTLTVNGDIVLRGDNISLGTLFLFISMSGLLFRPLRQIADRFNTLQMGMVAADRVFKLIDRDEKINDLGIFSVKKIKGSISFKDVPVL